MSTYQTNGIVLYRQDHQEHDRRYSIFTDDRGKISVLAKGTRKFKSKLAPHLEPFAVIDLLMARGKVIDKIASVERIENYKNISLSAGRLTTALAAAEIIEVSTRVDQPDEQIFEMIREMFSALNTEDYISDDQLPFLLSVFALRLLVILGFGPQLEQCVVCHNDSCSEEIYFSYRAGGTICAACFKKREGQIYDIEQISAELHQVIHWAREANFAEVTARSADEELVQQFQNIAYNLLINNIERDFQAFKTLRAMI